MHSLFEMQASDARAGTDVYSKKSVTEVRAHDDLLVASQTIPATRLSHPVGENGGFRVECGGCGADVYGDSVWQWR